MAANNPFTMVYNALWDMAENNDNLTALIKVGNREKYDSWVGWKKNISDSDLPELALLQQGAPLTNIRNSSSTSAITRNYEWAISTGDFVLPNYNEIVWELWRACHCWNKFLCPLTWNEHHFVKQVNLQGLTEGTFMTQQNRGIEGWASLLVIAVEMHFCETDIEQGLCD